jgi:hypothetical protein
VTDSSREAVRQKASDMEIHMKQKYVNEFLLAAKIAYVDIHRCLLNVYRDKTVDVSTVRLWVVYFSSGNSDVRDRSCCRQSCTAVSSQNEEYLDQLIHENEQITTRKLYMELNIASSALETMLKYRKVCARWFPWIPV